MSFPRYPEYKDSESTWLGDIPIHWDVRLGRRLYVQKRDYADKSDEQLSATQKYGVVPQRQFMELEDQKVTLALSGLENFKHVEANDFVISLRSFQGGIERSKFAGCVSPAYTVLRAAVNVDASFIAYVLKSDSYISVLQSVTDGIRDGKNISYEQFGQIALPYPPIPEQAYIATFLDRETAKIDALIAEQEQLIALLKEKRQAVISHTVTKGLNPDVPMKDSGIEWLGEVPAHWCVTRLKFAATVQTGVAKGKDNSGKETIEVPYLRVANVQDGYLDLDDVATIEIPSKDLARYSLKPGDVLMNEGGDFDKLGRGHLWEGAIAPCIHQNHVFAVRPFAVKPDWLNLYTCSSCAQFYFMSRSKQSTNLASISSANILEMPLLIPPEGEAVRIVGLVGDRLNEYQNLINSAQAGITLLSERRSSLISAAVTGSIDIRDSYGY